MERDINLYLQLLEPIDFYGINIKQPSLIEILKYGKDDYSRLLIPYIISTDSLGDGISEEDKCRVMNFDIICNEEEMFNLFVESVKYFCDVDNIEVVTTGIKVNEVVIDRDNFDEFSDIVLKINARERFKAEKIPVFQNDIQRDIWEKIQEGRKRFNKNGGCTIEDIVNYCEFGGKSHISVDEIKTWTLWKLMNCYKSIMGISSYEDSFSIFLISGEKSLLENKHWTDLVKLNYKSKEE